jgi:hypothetical protein
MFRGSFDWTWCTKGRFIKAWVHRGHEVSNPWHLPVFKYICSWSSLNVVAGVDVIQKRRRKCLATFDLNLTVLTVWMGLYRILRDSLQALPDIQDYWSNKPAEWPTHHLCLSFDLFSNLWSWKSFTEHRRQKYKPVCEIKLPQFLRDGFSCTPPVRLTLLCLGCYSTSNSVEQSSP